jgi:hypothetical protein
MMTANCYEGGLTEKFVRVPLMIEIKVFEYRRERRVEAPQVWKVEERMRAEQRFEDGS